MATGKKPAKKGGRYTPPKKGAAAKVDPSRTPPADVRRLLRQEVGFGCPVEGCGNPYLTYHHFDPEWSVKHHHNPEGMIALCREHHDKESAWNVEDFRVMKQSASNRTSVSGRFEWMKREVLTIAGGGFYFRNGVDIESRSAGPLVWYERDAQNRLLLNLRMLQSGSSSGTVVLEQNDWTIYGQPLDVESPPIGDRLIVKFRSGDRLSVRFREHSDPSYLVRTYKRSQSDLSYLPFPLVTAEISMNVPATGFRLDPKGSTSAFGRASAGQ